MSVLLIDLVKSRLLLYPGGHGEPGETLAEPGDTLAEAAIREVREETVYRFRTRRAAWRLLTGR
jgi:8-oxo-dGTP pyrophosphatase MutT (NUDIX family)